jgi:hypothetical protein
LRRQRQEYLLSLQAENLGEIRGAVGAQRRGARSALRTPNFADHFTQPEQLPARNLIESGIVSALVQYEA